MSTGFVYNQSSTPLPPSVYCRQMDNSFFMDLIESARKRRNLTIQEAADLAGISRDYYNKLKKKDGGKNQGRRLNRDIMHALAFKVAECDLDEMMARVNLDVFDVMKVPVVGTAGAGNIQFSVDDYAFGEAGERVDCPPDILPRGVVALRVVGDSMEPALYEGYKIFYRRRTNGVDEDAIGKLAVVRLENDGTLVKRLKLGSKPGRFHLLSVNNAHDPMTDVKLVWAAKVLSITPE